MTPAGHTVGVLRAAVRLAVVLALVAAGVALSPFSRRMPDRLVRRWCLAVVRAAGVRPRVTGAPAAAGGALLVANHISWLDVPLLGAVRPARMLAKQEIRAWPVAGAIAAGAGVLFIERDRLRALPDTVARIAGALRKGAAVGVFPEGSTWCGRSHGTFHRAAFQAALDAGVPVQPVRIRYGCATGTPSTAPAFVGEDTLLASMWRVTRTGGLTAEVHVRTPLHPGDHPDRRALAAAAEASVRGGAARRELRSGLCGPRGAALGDHPADGARPRAEVPGSRRHPLNSAARQVG